MPRKTKTPGTRRLQGVSATISIDMEEGQLVAERGGVRVVAQRWLSDKHCGCTSKPDRTTIPPPPSGGYVISSPYGYAANTHPQEIRVCGPCAVRIALAVLEHEVR